LDEGSSEEAPPLMITLELTIRPGSGRFGDGHDSWLAQESDLFVELSRDVGPLRRDSAGNGGTKGIGEVIVLALTSTQALNAATTCFRVWLARDRTRRITVSWTVAGRTETVVLDGSGVDEKSIIQIYDALRGCRDG
jgi:Effector Associated Constant Component 1